MRGTSRNSVEGPVPASTPADRGRSEAGDTLVEVLLAIVVLGLTSVALLAGFGTMISSSAQYRSLATMDTVLRSASQQAISQVGQQSALFASCQSAGPSGPGQVNFSLPAGYTAVVSSVQYWNASATPPAFNPPSTWLGTSFSPCIPNAPALLTITVTAASSGASSSIRSVVDEQQARAVAGAGAATQLVFLTEPGNGTAGSNLSPEPAVAVEDAEGNIVYSDLSDVKLTISGGTRGATLSNTCTGSEFYGVVTFSGCSVNMAGNGLLPDGDRWGVAISYQQYVQRDCRGCPSGSYHFGPARRCAGQLGLRQPDNRCVADRGELFPRPRQVVGRPSSPPALVGPRSTVCRYRPTHGLPPTTTPTPRASSRRSSPPRGPE